MSKELSVIESSVLSLIPRGKDKKVTLDYICKNTGLKVREVQSVINCLVFKYEIPVCADRSQGGVYIPINNEERSNGLNGIKSQVNNLKSRIKIVESADLNNWMDDLIYNYQEKLKV